MCRTKARCYQSALNEREKIRMRNAVHLVGPVVSGLPVNAARGHTLFSSGLLIPGMICPTLNLALPPDGRTHMAP